MAGSSMCKKAREEKEEGHSSSQGVGKTDIFQLNFAAFSVPLVVCVTGKAQKKVKLTFPLTHTHRQREREERKHKS